MNYFSISEATAAKRRSIDHIDQPMANTIRCNLSLERTAVSQVCGTKTESAENIQ